MAKSTKPASIFLAIGTVKSAAFRTSMVNANKKVEQGLISLLYYSVINGDMRLFTRQLPTFEGMDGWKVAAGKAGRYMRLTQEQADGSAKLSEAQKATFAERRATWADMDDQAIYDDLLAAVKPAKAAKSDKPELAPAEKLAKYIGNFDREGLTSAQREAMDILLETLMPVKDAAEEIPATPTKKASTPAKQNAKKQPAKQNAKKQPAKQNAKKQPAKQNAKQTELPIAA